MAAETADEKMIIASCRHSGLMAANKPAWSERSRYFGLFFIKFRSKLGRFVAYPIKEA